MYIDVCFKRKNGEYGGIPYTYECNFPVKTGDLVLAPTRRGDTPARVVSVGTKYDEIDPAWRDTIRSVTNRYTEPESVMENQTLFEGA